MVIADGPRITIVTASFNALDGLRRTVESVGSQDYPNVQHVVVDGGSTDGTRAYLESLGDAVSWISEPDEGIADALNKGIAMADGDYILVLQAADTFMDIDSASKALPYLDQDLVCFDVIFGDRIAKAGPYRLKTEFFMTVCHQGLFVRRHLFEEIGTFDRSLKISMDYDFVLRAKNADKSMRWINLPITDMDTSGVSSIRDWPSVSQRLNENQRIQRNFATSGFHRMVLRAFWFWYRPFKWLKTHWT